MQFPTQEASGIFERIGLIPSIILIVVVIGISNFIYTAIYNIYFHPLAKFTTNKFAAASIWPSVWALSTGELPFWTQKLYREANSNGNKTTVVRIHPNQLCFFGADSFTTIHGHRSAGQKTFDKDFQFYMHPQNNVDNLITAGWEDHSRQRRLVAHAFSDKALRDQEPLLQRYISLLISKLYEHGANTGKPIDVVRWFNFMTFDLIGDLAFGEPFDCLKDSEYHPWISMVFGSIRAGTFLTASKQFPMIEKLLKWSIPKKWKEDRHKNFVWAKEKMDRRLAAKVDRPDFVSAITRYNDEKGMRLEEIHSNASLFIVAGSETTATLLSGCTFFLLTHPQCLAKLLEEIRMSFKEESDINLVGTGQCRYLMACLEESLRLYPPVPIGLPRIVPEGGEVINGHFVPGGVSVSVPHYAVYRSPDNFALPEEWIPGRWLDSSHPDYDPRFASDKKALLQPFSYGPMNCLGRNLAYSEMRLNLARLFWNFDLELCEESRDFDKQKCFILWEKKELFVKIKARDGKGMA